MGADKHTCPRRSEIGQRYEEGKDAFTVRGIGIGGGKWRCCSYCGSMHPDDVMAGLSDGTMGAGPTDKNYKAYIFTPATPEQIKRKELEIDARLAMLDDSHNKENHKLHDMIAARSGADIGKFYFQHLSVDQRRQFLDLVNSGTMVIGYPGHFYTLPFFIRRG